MCPSRSGPIALTIRRRLVGFLMGIVLDAMLATMTIRIKYFGRLTIEILAP